jgi:lipopolysaccharide transport system ATP-binding protein
MSYIYLDKVCLLTKKNKFILKNINFTLKDGSILGITGKNGSGKTMLLRIINGGILPSSGTLKVDGKIISIINPRLGLSKDFTGLENIFLLGVNLGYEIINIKKILQKICSFSELDKELNDKISAYSSGQIARLVVSTILHLEADILLLDEWLSVTDKSFSNKVNIMLKKKILNSKIAVIASHDKNFLKSICNNIYDFNDFNN